MNTNMHLFRFLLEDGANEGGGGDTNLVVETNENNQAAGSPEGGQPSAEIDRPAISMDQMKAWGFDSIEQLDNHFKNLKEQNISPEEVQKKQQAEKVDFIKFSTDNSLMKLDEINQWESLQGKSDKDLVQESFVKEYLEENPNSDLEDANNAFELQYHIDSQNQTLKKRGELALQRDAKELKSPLEKSYTEAKSRFEEEKMIRTKMPDFDKFIDNQIKELTPDKIILFKGKAGEQEIDIDVDLTDADRKEIAQTFKNNKTFYHFMQGDGKMEEFQKSLSKKIQGFIKEKKFDSAMEKALSTGVGIGTKSGSNVGAENLFGTQAQINSSREKQTETIEQSNDKIAEVRRNYRNR